MNTTQHPSPPKSEASPTPTPETGGKTRVTVGVWGGSNILLDVSEVGARIEFACAHGTLTEPLVLQDGRFDVKGTFVRERGGPIREGAEEKGVPARYRGEVEGERMTLTFSLTADGSDGETFTLTKGVQPRLFKCK